MFQTDYVFTLEDFLSDFLLFSISWNFYRVSQKKAFPQVQKKKCLSPRVTDRKCKNIYFGKSDRCKGSTPVEMIKLNKKYSCK